MLNSEDVYYTLLGEMIDDAKVPGVENLFFSGSACDQNYIRMLEAYERLRKRMNKQEDDPDVETIINSLLENQRLIALKMFEYGEKKSRS